MPIGHDMTRLRRHGPDPARSRRRRRAPSLRRTWTTVLGALLVAMVLLGLVVLGVARHHESMFEHSTGHIDRGMGAIVALELALIDLDLAANGVMYARGGDDAYVGHVADYRDLRGPVVEALPHLDSALRDDPAVSDLVADVQHAWLAFDEGVRRAPARHLSGDVDEVLRQGLDPFAEEWDSRRDLAAGLTWARVGLLEELEGQMAQAEQATSVTRIAVYAAIALATAIAWGAARLMRRRVLGPLAQLTAYATRLHEGSAGEMGRLEHAVAELGTLGATLTETASTVRDNEARLRDQALTDELTGLPNRAAFGDALRTALGTPGRAVAVLFIDLDDFKVVNDSLGHAAGDELLRVVADRTTSAVDGRGVVARLGGDEFAVVATVEEAAALSQARALAEDVLAVMRHPAVIRGRSTEVACSIGVAIEQGGDAERDQAALGDADYAMYTAKQQGKNRIEVFAPGLMTERPSRAELRRDLVHAAADDQLVLHYQPVVDLQAMQVVGHEALLRWDHPTRGLLGPDQFVSLAEDSGDILGIGAWVLDRACADLRRLRERAPEGWVSVNVSSRQLDQPGFADVVRGTLQRHGIPAGSLMVEVTEAVAMTSTEAASAQLQAVREIGVRVALDDFGTGFSSLAHLSELPLDVLKVDRRIVARGGHAARATLEMVIGLARRLDLSVMAEGIEEEAELDLLRELASGGPVDGQGFLFARPTVLDALPALGRA